MGKARGAGERAPAGSPQAGKVDGCGWGVGVVKGWKLTPELLARESKSPLERTRPTAGQMARAMATQKLATLQSVTVKPSKYRNTKRVGPNFMGGEREYRSQWEASVAVQLRDEMMAGQIMAVMPEISFVVGQDDAGRDIRHRVDFGVIDAEGRLVLVEAKGFETPNGRTKRGVLKSLGLNVQVRTKAVSRRAKAGKR